MSVTCRKMNIKDVDFVYQLEKQVFGQSLEKKMLYDEILYNKMAYYVMALYEDKRAGYVGVWLTEPNAEIINIVLKPEMMGKGIGKALIEHVISHCKKKHIKKISLEVRPSNNRALRFYQRHGFEVVHTRKQYYQDHEDAYLMVKEVHDDCTEC